MNTLFRTRAVLIRMTPALRPSTVRFASQKKETVEWQTSEQNKVNVGTQVTDKDGTHTKSDSKWSPELASNSEEIIHAERKEGKKNHTMEELQKKSVDAVKEKEKKFESVDKKEGVQNK